MKRICSLMAALTLAVMFTAPKAQAQQAPPTQVEASAFAQWTMITTQANTATSPASFTVRSGRFASQGPIDSNGIDFTPIQVGAVFNIEAAGGTAESLTVLSANCPSGALENTCSFTANASYVHNAGARITSGDLGLSEAKFSVPSGTLIYVRKSISTTYTTSTASTTLSNFIPAGVFLDALVNTVQVALTGTTGFKVGDGTTTDLWGTTSANTVGTVLDYALYKTAYGDIGNTTQVGAAVGYTRAAASVVITHLVSNFTGGTIKTTATFHAVAP